jgi:hypothetical protein
MFQHDMGEGGEVKGYAKKGRKRRDNAHIHCGKYHIPYPSTSYHPHPTIGWISC